MITRSLCALVALAPGLSPVVDARPGRAVSAAAAGAGAAGAAPSKWTRLRTPNFTLLGEHGEKPLRRVAERMEQFREVFGRVFPSTRRPAPAPVIVHVFGLERAYQPFMPLFNGKRVDVGGYFQPTSGAYYITLSTEAGERAYPTIFHEYVHLLVGTTLADVPVVVQRGAGRVLQHLPEVRRPRGLARPRQGGARLRAPRALHPAEGSARRRSSIPLYNEGDRRGVFYAESWALVHYLLIGNPQRKGQVGVYLQKYADGVAAPAAFREAFGVSEAELEKELKRYVTQSLYPSNRVSFADKVAIDKDWIVDQPSDADGQAAYADLLYALRRPEDAAARAEGALKLTPGHARAQAVLARIRASQGQADAASTLIAGAVKAAADTDYLPSYYQAMLLMRGEGKHAPTITPDAARQARTLLTRVTTLEPSLADAHGLAAYAALAADEPKAAMDSAAIAFRLSPEHHYALMHARARVFLRDPAARSALDALVARGSSDWIRREAQELLDFLTRVENRPSMAAAAASTGAPAGTVDGSTAPAGPAKLIPVFRVVGDGEVREVGMFEGVECPRGGVIFKVRLPSRLLRVNAKAFDQVEFFSYRGEPPGQVACGARPKPERVYLTYRSTGGSPGTDGVAVAIELLPDDYQP